METLLTPRVQRLLPSSWVPAEPPSGWDSAPGLGPAFEAALAVTRHHARSFHFASHVLGGDRRRAAFALYAFCRHVDDAIDGAGASGREIPSREALLVELDRLLEGGGPDWAPAFAAMSRAFAMPRRFYEDLIEGCARDREPARIPDYPALEEYCYYVASVVGLMMARLFGLSDPAGVPRAVEMGVAMQLTNILRDVGEDLAMGRVYLPADELAAAGIGEDQLRRGVVDDRWRAFMRDQVARTRRYYASGARGLPLLAPGGPRRTATVMADVYGGILGAIERNGYDVFSRRARVPLPGKLMLAVRALL